MPRVIISDTSCLIVFTKIRETNFRVSKELEQIALIEANEQ